MEKKGIDWAVSVDKLKVCLNMPEHLFEYLKEYHTRYKGDVRILEEDDFFLVFTNFFVIKLRCAKALEYITKGRAVCQALFSKFQRKFWRPLRAAKILQDFVYFTSSIRP